jgi:hypothetical protein
MNLTHTDGLDAVLLSITATAAEHFKKATQRLFARELIAVTQQILDVALR